MPRSIAVPAQCFHNIRPNEIRVAVDAKVVAWRVQSEVGVSGVTGSDREGAGLAGRWVDAVELQVRCVVVMVINIARLHAKIPLKPDL